MKKAGIIHLGCAKNQVDTEIILGFLKEMGYTLTSSEEEADLLLVNTCAFIKPALEESESNIRSLEKYKKLGKKIVVTGCLVERFKKDLEDKFPFVDLFIGPGEYMNFKNLLNNDNSFSKKVITSPASNFLYNSTMTRLLFTPYSAYVKISEGCNNFCSYCTIPYIRGRMRSREIKDIANEVEKLVGNNVKEINIISQDTTRYGEDLYGKPSLAKLLSELEKIEGDFYIRLLYLYPSRLDDEIIQIIKNSEKIVPYFDIPLQHVNDEILKNMNRSYGKNEIINIWNKIRENFPDAVIRTTFIVGFPGESEEKFEELYNFIQEYYFDRLGVFPYYPEEGTKAQNLPHQIDEEEKKKRVDIIMSKQKEISKNLNKNMVGKELEIIVEGFDGRYFYGRSWREAPEVDGLIYIVGTEKRTIKIGEKVRVKIRKYKSYDLLGEIL
jgi:ribosomal protein S12 methylthiotransferase